MHLLAAEQSPRLRARVVAAVAAAIVCLHLGHLAVAAGAHVSIRSGVVVASAAVWAVVLLVAVAAPRGLSSAAAAALHVVGAVAVTADAVWSESPGHDVIVTAGLVSLAISAGALSSARASVVAGSALMLCQGTLVLSQQGTGPLGWYVAVSTVAVTAAACWVSASAREAWRSALADEATRALSDPLTGLLNRRGMVAHFPALRAAAPSGDRVAVVLLDVDAFKAVNDALGHDAGDQVLVAVAEVLRGAVRGGDLAVRLGGEEMAWVGAWPTAEDATAAAERLRAAVASARVPGVEAVTVSAGVAVAGPEPSASAPTTDADLLSRLLVRADRAMYAAKAAGRDRVEVAAATEGVSAAAPTAAASVHGAAAGLAGA
ncbi:diguanylate cyclase [Quadrisphaera sp. KR29]|uniref:diguanylate cyclase n=1 Tax=Quadrisphaera sp. KR29 TaxID=3461391 RepID=UPI0040442768